MKLQEYQSRDVLAKFGVPVPDGAVATTGAKAEEIARRLGGNVVVKAQVLMGGRGKAGGVKLFTDAAEAGKFASELIGKRLVSVQNPTGMIVEKVLISRTLDIQSELYISVLLDRRLQQEVVLLSAEGGMEIETIAEVKPESIIRTPIDPAWGLCDFEIRRALNLAKIPVGIHSQMIRLVQALVKAYQETDADLVEINPCAVTPEGRVIAADAKVSIDDNALYRRQDLLDGESGTSADHLIEAEAVKRGIAYVYLGGDIGIIGNGAGLVMQSLDEISAAGGKPANFLDVGGGAQADRVKQCVELILMDKGVKGLFINIFGGITRVDQVAKGVLDAFSEIDVHIPIVARIEGTAAEEGRKLLKGSMIVPAETVQEAAKKIVELSYAR